MSKLPKKIMLAPDVWFPIRQAENIKGLGYIDFTKEEIVINEDQPEVGKLIVLLHEIIHANDSRLKTEKIIKRSPDHNYVTHVSAYIVAVLGLAGLLKGYTKDEIRDFFTVYEN